MTLDTAIYVRGPVDHKQTIDRTVREMAAQNGREG